MGVSVTVAGGCVSHCSWWVCQSLYLMGVCVSLLLCVCVCVCVCVTVAGVCVTVAVACLSL